MDRIVLIAIAVAVIAVIGATLMLNPGGGGKTTPKPAEPVITPEEPEEPEVDGTSTPRQPRGNFTNATYGATVEEIVTDCQLYQHVVTNRFYCFSKSGKYGVMATNEYDSTNSTQYFCKGTKYGCTLYETVYIQPP